MTGPAIGFAGLTHLGLVSAAAAAAKGFAVRGYDPDSRLVGAVRAGKLPIVEPGLDEVVSQCGARLAYTDALSDLAACDLVYISTDVPTDGSGKSDLSAITALIGEVSKTLGPNALLIVLCQVPPGYTRRLPFPAERLFYQVETLAFGTAVQRALEPERFIVGCANPAKPLPAAYQAVLAAFACPILQMRYESAELAKISINCCLVASITVANTLAELSERVGADWNEIAPALRLDRRIGQHSYLQPGLGFAGGNLERDLATVLRLSEETGSDASVISAFVQNSNHCRHWALRVLHREVLSRKPDAVIGILGLAYKENTHSTRNSPSLALIDSIKDWQIRVFDPAVSSSIGHPAVTKAADPIETARGADVLLIMTPWPEFRKIAVADLAKAMRGKIIIDPYRVLTPDAVGASGMRYFTMGAPEAGREAGA